MNLFMFIILLIVIAEVKSTSVPYTQAENNSATTSTLDQASCKMMSTHRLQLDYECIEHLSLRNHVLPHLSLAECKSACCSQQLEPCDMVYLIRNEKCVLMNYYVLSFCPLLTAVSGDSTTQTLLLSISNRAIPYVKQQLLREHRQEVQTLLGCNNNQFVCDDWSCIKNTFHCDGSPQCSDRSDELHCDKSEKMHCRGIDEKFYQVGDVYTPHDETDLCVKCVCGNNSKPSYCYAPSCAPHPRHACDGPFPDACCRCRVNGPVDPSIDPSEPNYLSASQRLIVSCMSVLVIVALLLFFSRNIAHRGRQNSLRNLRNNRGQLSARYWIPPQARDLPHNRSFLGRYLASRDSVSFFDREGLPAVYIDLPPPYNALKPPPSSNNDSDASLPPSYSGSLSSSSSSSTSEGPSSPSRSLNNHCQDPPIRSDENQQTLSSPQPITPRSSSSDNPLLPNSPV